MAHTDKEKIKRVMISALIVSVFILLFSSASFAGLRLMVMASSAYTCNSSNTMDYTFWVYNSGPTAVPVSNISIRFWIKTSTHVPADYTNNANDTRASDNNGNVTNGNVSVVWSSNPPACPDANIQATLSFSANTTVIPVGGNLKIAGAAHLGSYAIFDPECDDWSVIGSTAQHSDLHYALYDTGVLVNQDTYGYANPPCAVPSPTNTPTTVGKLNCAYDSNGQVDCAFVELINSTPTFTPTFTATPTRTPTPTFTSTRTSTPTFTDTPTFTATPTPSYTSTHTPTRTATPTYTATSTFTDTRTYTPTSTSTPTRTDTNTYTPTYTPTDTISSNTPTATRTFTDTFTATPTFTMTSTFTATKSITPSVTETLEFTATVTPTYTPSRTMTDTFTATSTFTDTKTVTPTFTNTPVNSSTFTRTYTPTFTATPTFTDTPTFTSTRTSTPTATPSFTPTNTPTYTSTYTATPTFTETWTSSVTPTVTPTTPPFPYLLRIGVYNSAGELVRTIGVSVTSAPIGNILWSTNGDTDPSRMSPTAETMTSENPLYMYLPGINTPSDPTATGTLFNWGSITDGNQLTGGGIYYIKFEELDMYGHTNVLIKEISLLVVQQYVEVNIFNSAGELVKTIRDYKDVSNTNIALKVGNNNTGMVVVEKGINNISITYGTSLTDYVTWDGLNDQGLAVTSGNYEVQVNLVTNQGRTTVASKTIIVLSEKSSYMGNVSIQPNPYVNSASTSKTIRFAWDAGTQMGWMNVSVYNLVGEKVVSLDSNLQSGSVVWDLKTGDGSKASNGYFVVVFEAKNSTGRIDRKIEKLAMVGKK